MSDDAMVTLIPRDGDRKFEIPVSIANISSFVKDSLETDGDDDEDSYDAVHVEIPVPNVSTEVLEKVVEFMKHYAEEPMTPITTPLRSDVLANLVQEWYANFVRVPRNLLFDMVAAANFMDIKPLLDLTCLATSILIKGKSAEELRDMFNVSSDVSAENEQEVKVSKE